MKSLKYGLFFILLTSLITSCAQEKHEESAFTVDRDQLLEDVRFLASDSLEGRRTGTEGNAIARRYIENRFSDIGVSNFGHSYFQTFTHVNTRTGNTFEDAVNIVGLIRGTSNSTLYMAVTAHYDHLGVHNGEIYNGADDNASGVGGLLALAQYFTDTPPLHNILLISFDAEEQGLGGARFFVDNPVVPLDNIVLNINMDMISTNFVDELYAVGTYHYPFLKSFIEKATAGAEISVLFGHDSPDLPPIDDWTMSSDHGPFHAKGVPFIYFGVEDHPHYHQPTDTFETINPDFYVKAVGAILNTARHLDANLEAIYHASEREE
ncbi:MAG: M28 family peptidase [Balneolaceae bacterium]|nr:MAG: M28 family peptidase [Balneolaceae bacterium]